MSIVLTIVITLALDWGIGSTISYRIKKRDERNEEEFRAQLQKILTNKNMSGDDRKYSALELCRNTKGKMSAGSYFALYDVEVKD